MTTADREALEALRIPELKQIAADRGLRGVSTLRKGALIERILAEFNSPAASAPATAATRSTRSSRAAADDSAQESTDGSSRSRGTTTRTTRRSEHTGRGRRVVAEVDAADATSSQTGDEDTTASHSRAERSSERSERGRGRNFHNDRDAHSENNDRAERTERTDHDAHDDHGDDVDEHGQKLSRSAARRARRRNALQAAQQARLEKGEQRTNQGKRFDPDSVRPGKQGQRSYNRRSQDGQGYQDQNNQGSQGNNQAGNSGNSGASHQGYGYRDRDNSQGNGAPQDRMSRSAMRRNRRQRGVNQENGGVANNETLREGEHFQTVAGILDIVDQNTAFLRTSGYQPGQHDVYVPISMVRANGMRRGDSVKGRIRVREDGGMQAQQVGRGRQRQRFTPLAVVDQVSDMSPAQAKLRPEFAKLTPLYPNQRLRLETEQKILTTRVIDLIMPIGKGQRALIVSPPKAGKTTILQNIANAITQNSPECYLMVVLVDERPEEVTDMQRSVKGEVIASTFDRPPSEHTTVAELAIERAKRLVECGKDVVVLLDSITRLGRAYNNSSPASGRILSGGVDSNALYPPKRFLGAARNIEDGGSLTIIATAMVETGSAGDTVIFEEFKGTGNAELKLDRKIAERRVFPAVDVNPSGTRKDELLLSPEEARIMHKLRRILSALDPQQAIDMLIKQLRKTKSNKEFLIQVASSGPMGDDQDDD